MSASVRCSGASSSILVTLAAFSGTSRLNCVFSSSEYHVDFNSALDLHGNNVILLVGEKETDLTTLGLIIGRGSSTSTISSEVPEPATMPSSEMMLLLNEECCLCLAT
jgi:hypothetical protein